MRLIGATRLALALLATTPLLAQGHGEQPEETGGTVRTGHGMKMDHEKVEQHPFGRASDPAQAERTVRVTMSDRFRFDPPRIEVRQGDAVRFVVRNEGKLMHEMVLGTEASLREHAALMKRFPGMEHEEPHMARVAPGTEQEMGWRFTEAGEFFYGCLVPGHYDAGMVGTIVVR